MVIFLIFAFLILIYKSKFVSDNGEYLSKYQTTCINGFFVILVFFRHFRSYISLDSILDKPFLIFDKYLIQLLVVSFLFYSGYGVMESIKKKKESYVKKIPKNRFMKVLLHFDIAVVFFWIVQKLLGNSYSLNKILLSFIGWENLGNSNWYILAVLVAYLITYISFTLFKKDNFKALLSTSFLSIIYVLFMYFFKPRYCYDTFLCYLLGMYYSYYKEDIENLLRKKEIYILILFLLVNLFVIYFVFRNRLLMNLLLMLIFALLIVIISKKYKVGNKVLLWLGTHAFSIYILQRIPMILFSKVDIIISSPYIFLILSLIMTLIISVLFDIMLSSIDRLLFREKIRVK